MPPSMVASLEIPWLRRGRAVLADGRSIVFDVHDATLLWDGRPRRVAVGVAESQPLIGMALLDGFALTIDVVPAGRVTIERMS